MTKACRDVIVTADATQTFVGAVEWQAPECFHKPRGRVFKGAFLLAWGPCTEDKFHEAWGGDATAKMAGVFPAQSSGLVGLYLLPECAN